MPGYGNIYCKQYCRCHLFLENSWWQYFSVNDQFCKCNMDNSGYLFIVSISKRQLWCSKCQRYFISDCDQQHSAGFGTKYVPCKRCNQSAIASYPFMGPGTSQ